MPYIQTTKRRILDEETHRRNKGVIRTRKNSQNLLRATNAANQKKFTSLDSQARKMFEQLMEIAERHMVDEKKLLIPRATRQRITDSLNAWVKKADRVMGSDHILYRQTLTHEKAHERMHAIRNRLTAIQMALSLLEKDGAVDKEFLQKALNPDKTKN